MNILLHIEKMSMRFGGLYAVSDLDLQVHDGEIRALIGPNGAGKTTILNVISGIYCPTHGTIQFDHKKISGLPPYVITRFGNPPAPDISERPDFPGPDRFGKCYGGPSCEKPGQLFIYLSLKSSKARREETSIADKQIVRCSELVGIAERKEMNPLNLPYGQKRLMEIARALATEPKMILLDEPSAGMYESETLQPYQIDFQNP